MYLSHFERYLMGLYGDMDNKCWYFLFICLFTRQLTWLCSGQKFPYNSGSNISSFFKIFAMFFRSEENKKRVSVGYFSVCTQCAVLDVPDNSEYKPGETRGKNHWESPHDLMVRPDIFSFPNPPAIYFSESSSSCSCILSKISLYSVRETGRVCLIHLNQCWNLKKDF